MLSNRYNKNDAPLDFRILELDALIEPVLLATMLPLIGRTLRRLVLPQFGKVLRRRRNPCHRNCPDLETLLLGKRGQGESAEGFVSVLMEYEKVRIGWCEGLPSPMWEFGQTVMEWLEKVTNYMRRGGEMLLGG